MSFKNKLLEEFIQLQKEKNPKITSDIEAVVVLSGESRDPALNTDLKDTEERLAEGIKIYKEIKALGGFPTLILNGTDPQNIFMENEAKENVIHKLMIIKNPRYPRASTDTQMKGLTNLNFKKIAIVTHAWHGVRVRLNAIKRLPKDISFNLFLLSRNNINDADIEMEIEKIQRYLE